MITINDYIIDFDRVNQLTTSIYDEPDSENYFGGKFGFSVSRKVIKEYIDIFQSINARRVSDDKIEHIVNTLEYNGIIVHKSTIRDKKINEILEE